MDRNTGLKLTWFQVPLFQKQTTSGAVLASPPHILDIPDIICTTNPEHFASARARGYNVLPMNFKHKCSPNHPGKSDRKCRRGILADYKVCILLLFGSAKSRPQRLWPP